MTFIQRCGERGCPFPPGPGGLCPEHEREQPASSTGYRWNGTGRTAEDDLAAEDELADWARCWARACCTFGAAYPYISCGSVYRSWAAYAAQCPGADEVTGDVAYAELISRGAVPATRPDARGYAVRGFIGVQLRNNGP